MREDASVAIEAGKARNGTVAARARAALGEGLERTRPGVKRDKRGYVVDLEDNLLPGITRAQIEEPFGGGAGQELEGKMRAPWSSSALAVNAFAPWQEDPEQLTLAGMSGFTKTLAFEAQCPNGVSAIPPHLDVLLERGQEIVGVESKCTEYLSPKKKVVVSAKYLKLAERLDERASSRWFQALTYVPDFRLVDAYQLVKHYLGLALQYRGRPLTLVYLYWEPMNAAAVSLFAEHRAEIDRFAGLVDGDATCGFRKLSYVDHWRELDALVDRPSWLEGHLAHLRRRYLLEL